MRNVLRICLLGALLTLQFALSEVQPAGAVGIEECDEGEICFWSSMTSQGGPQGSYTDWTPQNPNYGGDGDLSNNPYEIQESGFALMMDDSISFVVNYTPHCFSFYEDTGQSGFLLTVGPDQIVAIPLHDPNWNNVISSFSNDGLCETP